MSALLKIGELAAAAGVPTSTVRYYERRGLLPPDSRSRSKYRLYGDAALERLRFIRLAQSTGFALGDIASLLESRENHSPSRVEVRAMLEHRLADVRSRMSDLQELEAVLRRSLQACARGGKGPCCPVVERLTVNASGGKKSRTNP